MSPPNSNACLLTPRPLGAGGVLLLLFASLPLFWNLGFLSLRFSESRWLFIVREMLSTGDWFSLQLDGEFYGDKPYLSYWAIAVAAKLFGGLDEGTARTPSALAATATVLLTGFLGARAFGRPVGVLSGFVLATSFGLVEQARLASADAWNLFFTTAAVALLAELRTHGRAPVALAFGACMGVGCQAKGLGAAAVPLSVAILDAARRLSSSAFPAPRLPLRTVAFAAVLVAAAFAGAYFAPFVLHRLQRGDWTLLELAWRENVVRAVKPFDHRDEGPLYYTYILPALMLPWGIWLPLALTRRIAAWRREPGAWIPLAAFVAAFAVYTASGSRRSYYILPAMPFASILTASFLLQRVRGEGGGPRGLSTAARLLELLAAATLLAVGIGVALVPLLPPRFGLSDLPAVGWVAFAALAAGLLLFAGVRRGWGRLVGIAWLGAAAAITLYNVGPGDRIRARSHIEKAFMEEVRAHLGGEPFCYFRIAPGGPLRFYGGPSPILNTVDEVVTYRERRRESLTPEESGRSHLQAPPAAFLVCRADAVPTLRAALDPEPVPVVRGTVAHLGPRDHFPAVEVYTLLRLP